MEIPVAFRLAWRRVRREPFAFLALVATLALAVTAVGTTVGIGTSILWRPLPFSEPSRLVLIHGSQPAEGVPITQLSWPTIQDWLTASKSFSAATAFGNRSFVLFGDDFAENLPTEVIGPDFFELLRIEPKLGQRFSVHDPGDLGLREALIGERLWRRRFAGNNDVIGKTIRIDSLSFQVVGVVPESYRGLQWEDIELWLPTQAAGALLGNGYLDDRRLTWLMAIGRLAPNQSALAADGELDNIAGRVRKDTGVEPEELQATVQPLERFLFPDNLRQGLTYLALAGFAFLFLCMANIANLVLSQQLELRGEIAMHKALGAGRASLFGAAAIQLAAAGALGLASGIFVASRIAGRLVAMSDIPPSTFDRSWITPSAIGLTTISVVAALGILYVVPVAVIRGVDTARLTRSAIRSGSASLRLREALIVGELAVALALLAIAGLMIRNVRAIALGDPGFKASPLIVSRVDLAGDRYQSGPQQVGFAERAIDAVATIPGIDLVAAVGPRIAPNALRALHLRPVGSEDREPALIFRHGVSQDYFRVLGIPLLEGRLFDERDRAAAPRVAIVSRSAAQALWPGGALGESFELTPAIFGEGAWQTVGVVSDVRARGNRPSELPDFDIYLPLEQAPQRELWIVAHSSVDPRTLVGPLRTELLAADPMLPAFEPQTMTQRLGQQAADERFVAVVTGLLSMLAGSLAIVGVFALCHLSATYRRKEFALRQALGATRRDVVVMAVRRAALLAVLGIGIGLLLFAGFRRFVAGFLTATESLDPWTMSTAGAVLFIASILAALGPAIHASRTDPNSALRST